MPYVMSSEVCVFFGRVNFSFSKLITPIAKHINTDHVILLGKICILTKADSSKRKVQ